MANKRKIVVPEAREALNQMKLEIANEVGMTSNNQIVDKGNLTSRQNGYIGSSTGAAMTRKLVEMAENQMKQN